MIVKRLGVQQYTIKRYINASFILHIAIRVKLLNLNKVIVCFFLKLIAINPS